MGVTTFSSRLVPRWRSCHPGSDVENQPITYNYWGRLSVTNWSNWSPLNTSCWKAFMEVLSFPSVTDKWVWTDCNTHKIGWKIAEQLRWILMQSLLAYSAVLSTIKIMRTYIRMVLSTIKVFVNPIVQMLPEPWYGNLAQGTPFQVLSKPFQHLQE